MERLTEKYYKTNGGYYMKCSEHCENDTLQCDECDELDEMVDRLGAIEDILGDDYDLERLNELVEAEQMIEKTLLFTKWFMPGVQIVNGPIQRSVIMFSALKDGEILIHLKDGAIPNGLIGKCAYKTREAAEDALKGERDG